MKFRQFLLRLRYFILAKRLRRINRRQERLIREQQVSFELKSQKLSAHYDRQLTKSRLEKDNIILFYNDRLLQFVKLTAIGGMVTNVDGDINENLHPDHQIPPEDPESGLNNIELDFYLDAKEGFMEYETTENGRSEVEALRIWNQDFRRNEVARAKSSILK